MPRLSPCLAAPTAALLLSAGAAPARSATGTFPGSLSGNEGRFCHSSRGGDLAQVHIPNRTHAYRGIVHIGPRGDQDVGGVNHGESRRIRGPSGSVLMVTDGPGDCREMAVVGPGRRQFRMTVRN